MGYQDRDYFRPQANRWYWRTGGSVCRTLVIINVIVFVVQVLSAPGLAYSFRGGSGFFTDLFVMDPVAVFERGEVWRLFTSFFLHSPFSLWHLVVNMVVLWFFGPDMEDMYGPKEFLVFYLVAGVLSSLLWGLGAYWFEPLMHSSFLQNEAISEEGRAIYEMVYRQHRTALGASGAVTAVMILCAWHYPHREVLLFFVLSVPLWLVAVIYVAADFMVLYQGTPTGTGVVAHLSGAAFATLYYYFNWRIVPLGSDVWSWFKRRRGPKLRIVRSEPKASKNADFDDRVDEVLAKLKAQGREKLSPEELEILQQASERYRKRKG